jgi:tRNA(adenine34) deaminase
MSDEEFMQLAIDEAKQAELEGGCAIGAVIVKDGKVIAAGRSIGYVKRDPTNHAEIDCIRNCAKQNDMMNMGGCTLYGTLEPCSMCMGASLWAGIDRVIFGAYAEDVAGNNYEYINYSSEDLAKTSLVAANKGGCCLDVYGGVLREECKNLLKDYKNWQKQ